MIDKISLIIVLSLVCGETTYSQVAKTLHQTFTIESAEKINVDLDKAQNIFLKDTKGSRILVETKVRLSLPNQSLLDFVVNNGRYNLIKSIDKTTRELTLSSNKQNNVIVVKGQTCQEYLTYTIYMPGNVHVSDNR